MILLVSLGVASFEAVFLPGRDGEWVGGKVPLVSFKQRSAPGFFDHAQEALRLPGSQLSNELSSVFCVDQYFRGCTDGCIRPELIGLLQIAKVFIMFGKIAQHGYSIRNLWRYDRTMQRVLPTTSAISNELANIKLQFLQSPIRNPNRTVCFCLSRELKRKWASNS